MADMACGVDDIRAGLKSAASDLGVDHSRFDVRLDPPTANILVSGPKYGFVVTRERVLDGTHMEFFREMFAKLANTAKRKFRGVRKAGS
jgi:hypothetical protein